MKSLITRNPKILGGKPIIAGTRMSVESVLELLAGGMEIKEIIKEYPFLKREYISAAIKYAAESMGSRRNRISKDNEPSGFQAVPHEISRGR